MGSSPLEVGIRSLVSLCCSGVYLKPAMDPASWRSSSPGAILKAVVSKENLGFRTILPE